MTVFQRMLQRTLPGTSSCRGCVGAQHAVMLDFNCTSVLVMQAGVPPFSPLTSPSQPAFKRGSMCWRVAELLGWQGDGTHAPFLRVMIDTCEEWLCFWVRRYLPTPAHSHDSIASSTFKFRHPDSPLNLYHPAKPSYVVKSDLTEIALCGLMLIAAIHISKSAYVSTQTVHLPDISEPKLLSANLIFFFHTKTLLATCQPCTAEPGLGNLSSALKCQLSTAQMPKAPWGVYGQPCSPSPWWTCSAVNVTSYSHSALHPVGNFSLLREAHGLIQLPGYPCLGRAEHVREAAEPSRARVCLCTYQRSELPGLQQQQMGEL